MSYFKDLFGYAEDLVDDRKVPVRSACISCTPEQIKTSLAVLSECTVNHGATISYDKQFYALFDDSGRKVFLHPKTKITVARLLEGGLYATKTAGLCFTLIPVPNRYDSSPEFQKETAGASPDSIPKPRTPVPEDHLWKIGELYQFKKKRRYVEDKQLYVSPYEQTYW